LLNETDPKHLRTSLHQAQTAIAVDRSLATRFAFWQKRARHRAVFRGRTIRVKREVTYAG
jgi:hypothetical protein